MHDGERQNNVPVARLLCKLVLLSAVTGPLFATTQAPSGQSVSHPTAGVTSVRISRTVSVQMTVFSAKKELLIPYCAEGEGGTEILCNLSIHIETRAEWRPMKPGTGRLYWEAYLQTNGSSGSFLLSRGATSSSHLTKM